MLKKLKSLLVLAIMVLFVAKTSFAAGTSLNFKNANIRDVISAVSKATGKNFLIDPRVSGNVTLLSSSEMEPDALYNVFLSILRMHGFIAAKIDNNVIEILPISESRTASSIEKIKKSGINGEVVLRVIPIKYSKAIALIPILRPLVSRNAHIVAHNDSNSLLVSDSRSNIKRMQKLVNLIDSENKTKFNVITLENSEAGAISKIINNIFRLNKNKNTDFSIIPESRTNSLLINSTPERYKEIRAAVRKLDIPATTSGDLSVIKVNHSKASDIEKIINKMIAPTGTKGGGQSIAIIQGKVKISVDVKSNSIVIMGLPKSVKKIRQLVRKLDIKRQQVLVEAIIAEVNAEKAKNFGLQWGKSMSLSAIKFGSSLSDASALDTTAVTGSTTTTTSERTIEFEDAIAYGILMELLGGKSDAKTNLLSAPSILTMENEEAVIEVGQEVPFITGTKIDGNTGGGAFQSISRKNIGIKLRITPQIDNEGTVKLEIDQEISGILPNAMAQANASDIITSKRLIKTNVLVKDKSILVLGGLIDDAVLENERPTTFFAQIPILGTPFRQRASSKSKRNLMIFIRPTIVSDDENAAAISNERYNFIRELQLIKDQEGVDLLPEESQPVLEQLEQPNS